MAVERNSNKYLKLLKIVPKHQRRKEICSFFGMKWVLYWYQNLMRIMLKKIKLVSLMSINTKAQLKYKTESRSKNTSWPSKFYSRDARVAIFHLGRNPLQTHTSMHSPHAILMASHQILIGTQFPLM